MGCSLFHLKRAAFSMQSGKCPGLDGLLIEYYKTFFDKLAPVLFEILNELFNSLKLLLTHIQSSISCTYKKEEGRLAQVIIL